jgi:hypothetical protein
MQSKNRHRTIFYFFSLIWGLLFTAFMLLMVAPRMLSNFITGAGNFISVVQESFSDPLDPTLYFILYIVGYIVIWWKPLWGSIIVITSSILYVSVAGFNGPVILAAPGFLVGLLYFVNWFAEKNIETKVPGASI